MARVKSVHGVLVDGDLTFDSQNAMVFATSKDELGIMNYEGERLERISSFITHPLQGKLFILILERRS